MWSAQTRWVEGGLPFGFSSLKRRPDQRRKPQHKEHIQHYPNHGYSAPLFPAQDRRGGKRDTHQTERERNQAGNDGRSEAGEIACWTDGWEGYQKKREQGA